MRTIRTVFRPDITREVDDHEAAQLEREGLLLPLEEPEAAPTPTVVPKPTPAAPAAPTTPAKEATPDGDKQAQ